MIHIHAHVATDGTDGLAGVHESVFCYIPPPLQYLTKVAPPLVTV